MPVNGQRVLNARTKAPCGLLPRRRRNHHVDPNDNGQHMLAPVVGGQL